MMKQTFKLIVSCLLVISIFFSSVITSSAHSGRTDSNGGHKDNKNVSGLGSYHYHCGGYPAHLHVNGYCPYRDVFPSGVTISVGSKTLRKGETTTFKAEVYPSYSCDTHVDWDCDNTSVIRISGNTITALNYGTAVIKAESFNGKTASVKIVVKEVTADKVTITSPLADGEKVYIGDTLQCSAAISPADVDNPSIKWSSSDDNIAIVDNKGNVKALKDGKVTIMATAANGVVGKYNIHVKEKFVEKVELSEEHLDVLLQSKHALSATVTPADATFPDITWTSSDPSIVTVDENGSIHAIASGTATITATSKNGISDSIKVSVSEVIAERIEICGGTAFYINEECFLKANIFPENTTIQDIEWTSSDPKVITIVNSGKMRCLSVGVVTITAKQKDVTATIDIEVKAIPAEKIDICSSLASTKEFKVGDTLSLSASVYPDNATYKEITWSSSNSAIVSIDSFGKVTANTAGTAIITASTKDGFSQEYEITVSHTAWSFAAMLLGQLTAKTLIQFIATD